MAHTIEELVTTMGLAAAVATESDTATVSAGLPDKCALLGNRPVRIADAHAGAGYATGTVKRGRDGSLCIQELRYWPPEGGSLDLDIVIDEVQTEGGMRLRSSTLGSTWAQVAASAMPFGKTDLEGQTTRVRVSRQQGKVLMVLSANGSQWEYLEDA
jgi:hypothetical protein